MAAGDTCKGTCNSAYRKARALHEAELAAWEQRTRLEDLEGLPARPEPPDIQPWPGEPVWCVRCQATIRRELAELDDLAAMLAAMPPGIRPAITGQREHVKVSGTREQPSPSGAVEELDELGGWLRDWESACRGQDTMARRGYLATAITTGVTWLVAHFDAIISHPDLAQDFGEETRRWHRELVAYSHAGSAAKHVKKPCPQCSTANRPSYTLWEVVGEDYIKCVNEEKGCRAIMTRAELQERSNTALVS